MLQKIFRVTVAALLAALLSSGALAVFSPHDGTGLGSVTAVGACPIIDPDCPH